MPKDNTKQTRGFSYQRNYSIYYFLNENSKEIIEEGFFNGKSYEDISIKTNDNKFITYQIKYHNEIERFNRSSEIFKVLSNKNNFECDNIYYIVSNDFDEKFNIWIKNDDINKICDMIHNLDKDNAEVTNYKNTINLFKSCGKEKTIEYLNKFIITKGYSNDDLISKTNDKIQKVFKVNDKCIIFYIRYKIYNLFETMFFSKNNNTLLNIEISIFEIQNEDIVKNKIFTNDEHQLFINEYINTLIINIKNNYFTKKNNQENTLNLINEIMMFENLYFNNFNLVHILQLIKILEKIYKEYEYIQIKKYYKNLCKKLCSFLLKYVRKIKDNIFSENIENISKSLHYYYSHDIKNKINIEKSGIKNLFNEEELLNIKNIDIMLTN